jgi:FAD/FMN-containing dehydrogenase
MHDVTMQNDFVPQGCQSAPQRAVTIGSGAIWSQAYDVVTTKGGGYVQGGGCTTVGVAGLIQSGGFGSFSKHFGMAAASLLEAEVVTADGTVRIANACTNPDLFWALKGGGGGTFGAVSKLTLRVHDLPEFGGGANFSVKAVSDEAYRRLIRRFYRESLFNALLETTGSRSAWFISDWTRSKRAESGSRFSIGWRDPLVSTRSSLNQRSAACPCAIGGTSTGATNIIMTYSRLTLAREPARAASGGTETLAKSAGSCGVSSRYGCRHHCSTMTRKTHWPMRCSPRPALARSSFISTKGSRARRPM